MFFTFRHRKKPQRYAAKTVNFRKTIMDIRQFHAYRIKERKVISEAIKCSETNDNVQLTDTKDTATTLSTVSHDRDPTIDAEEDSTEDECSDDEDNCTVLACNIMERHPPDVTFYIVFCMKNFDLMF